MEGNEYTPNNLTDSIRYFSDEDLCIAYLVSRRWPDGVVKCPTCGSTKVHFLANQRRWKCSQKHDRRQFSVKVGTIFEDSPLSLTKWLPAVWMIGNCKNGVSSCEIARDLDVCQKTAWFMLHRIRFAMQRGSFEKFGGGGPVEADETFIGGRARFMHKNKKAKITGTGGAGKELVMGLLDRGTGKVRVKHIGNRKRRTLHDEVRANVKTGAELFTDELASYTGLDKEFVHQFVNHAEEYVKGNVHTNGMENFWSLLKRGLKGTYVSVEPFHLFRYLDEQAFRYNERKHNKGDAGRFAEILSSVADRRLTYKQLTGNTDYLLLASVRDGANGNLNE
jgi:transposase-like protein